MKAHEELYKNPNARILVFRQITFFFFFFSFLPSINGVSFFLGFESILTYE